MSDETKQEETVWTEELLRERRKRATIMAIALLAFIALFFWVTLIKLGANVANRPLKKIHERKTDHHTRPCQCQRQ